MIPEKPQPASESSEAQTGPLSSVATLESRVDTNSSTPRLRANRKSTIEINYTQSLATVLIKAAPMEVTLTSGTATVAPAKAGKSVIRQNSQLMPAIVHATAETANTRATPLERYPILHIRSYHLEGCGKA